MFKANQILSNYGKIFLLGIGFVVFYSAEVSAQEVRDCDRDRHYEEEARSQEHEYAEVPFEEYKPEKVTSSKPAKSSVKERKENPIYKSGGEQETKKEEMSTLSFNLFLYIVDRFKED
ncbi:hypothetical protein [Echinicola vietnamensis]|uniref:Uncharacterized protein n=1 Tax=Echinicola vietnamensis (strain DSM 17526 / LMG 23754 / KMM 6221) TaxID=926556 RepID=L0FXI1_ECHVK|nr:hypothetical protein [Echinicola vietnamensis]AGA77758.1 hypothetical protein Echvi_1492 [Echinicola vietnamensis DSM 17526]